MTAVLSIDPLLYGMTRLSWLVMATACKGFAVTGGRKRVRVPTSANLGWTAIPDGADALDATIQEHLGEDIIVFGYSQGAQIAGEWLRRNPDGPDGLRFLLIGNLERGAEHGAKPGGRYANGKPLQTTPNDTKYEVLDVARYGDKWANPQPEIGAYKANVIHSSYVGVDVINPTILSEERVGNTRYLVVP